MGGDRNVAGSTRKATTTWRQLDEQRQLKGQLCFSGSTGNSLA